MTKLKKDVKVKKSLIEDVDIRIGRYKGNTTRQVNKAIDLLFDGYVVIIKDHWENGENIDANYELFNAIILRLKTEHQLDELIKLGKIRIDKKKFEIELLP